MWEGLNRYFNCQNFHQPVGCVEDEWYKLRVSGFGIACVIIFMPCACLLCASCGEGGGGGGYTRVRKFVLVEV